MKILVLITLPDTLLDIVKGYNDFLLTSIIEEGVDVLVNREIIYNILIVNSSNKLIIIEKGSLITTLSEFKPEG